MRDVSAAISVPSMSISNVELSPESIRWARLLRKDALGHGEQKRIAEKLGVDQAYVSKVVNGREASIAPETRRKIQKEIARRLRMTVAEAFPESEQAA